MANRITKSDLLYVISECKTAIENVQPDVHPYMHPKIRADEKRCLEVAYHMLEAAEEAASGKKKLAEAYINQAIGLMKAWDIDVTSDFDERILGPSPSATMS